MPISWWLAIGAASLLPVGLSTVAFPPGAAEEPGAECLLYHGDGCHEIDDEELCLSSRDGRPEGASQPCAWCAGLLCGSVCWGDDWGVTWAAVRSRGQGGGRKSGGPKRPREVRVSARTSVLEPGPLGPAGF